MTTGKGDSLGDRMKGYEDVTRHSLVRRMPIIIRVDGQSFHTFVKCLKNYDPVLKTTPFSTMMHNVMSKTMIDLMFNVQNSVFGYTQSDEISILLRDWDKHETQQWFDGTLQKMCSIGAANATAAFNFHFSHLVRVPTELKHMARFDARVYNLPREEVTNYFIWRQQDAMRNSVQMLGRHYFSQKQMHGLNNMQVKDKMHTEEGVAWEAIPTWQQRGSCAYQIKNNPSGSLVFDDDIPVFSQQRVYVDNHLILTEF
jgi:tRNA(His) guanylyltransferase